jgi:SAM-dependent methyltransferase
MKESQAVRRVLLILSLIFIGTSILFAQENPEYQPQVGQPGKDVVWVPTQQDLVNEMLKMARVTPQDYVIDLGSGDGRTVITAAKLGATALGIEYNPDMVELSRRNAATAGVAGKATFVKADLFETDLSKATVITMFLLPDINLRLRPRLLNLKPGTRIVSNSFTMDDWEADGTITLENGCTTWCTAYLWIIPAKVEGKWALPDGELDLSEKFQEIKGTLTLGGKKTPIAGKMNGTAITFIADGTEYEGSVDGEAMKIGAKAGGHSLLATRMQ